MIGEDPIPVSVLTGFLGSGKTTVLSRLLRQPEFSRTAVIINEFGEIGLDHALIETSEDSVIALTTGCLCCKVRTDLTQTLQDLLRRRDEGSCSKFDRVVIETSGLADPAPILHALMTDVTVADRLALGSVVTTVDAVNGCATLEREAISRKQVAVADRIVLSKLDLTDGTVPELLSRLTELNPGAPTLRAAYGCIESIGLFDAPLCDWKNAPSEIKPWPAEARGDTDHRHGAEMKTYTVARTAPIPAVALTLFLEALAEHCGADLLRLKGIVNVAECSERPAVIHGVQHVFHAPAWLDRWPSAERRSRMVFITRSVPQRWVELLLDVICGEVADVSAPA
ncbi:MAG: CobW family GTP-binding protein [Xanthobacteraceae bacterium]